MCFGRSVKDEENYDHLNSRPVDPLKSSKVAAIPTTVPYNTPAGPPPGYQQGISPPVGPPPSHQNGFHNAPPPPGPPIVQGPYHDWQSAVPDTALLPPPPALGEYRSPTNNATLEEANNADRWCASRPLIMPLAVAGQEAVLHKLEAGDLELYKPPMYQGDLRKLRTASWYGKTRQNAPDSCLISALPLYVVQAHSPLPTRNKKTIYFEVKILRGSRPEVSLGLGFIAMPYPPFRLPGWERASLGVHGDDGHRYVNDKCGGKSFTEPFRPGQTVGIGMTFSPQKSNLPPAYGEGAGPIIAQQNPIDVEVFFTRDGERDGVWNIHEEADAEEDLPVTGLEGFHDLYAAIGTFDDVEFEIHFAERDWLYHP